LIFALIDFIYWIIFQKLKKKENFPQTFSFSLSSQDAEILVDGKESRWESISGASLKKNKKSLAGELKKADKASQASTSKADALAEETARRLEESKTIVLVEDKNLTVAKRERIRNLESLRGQRVKVFGWVDRIRTQGKTLAFILLRDGTGYLQCVLVNKLVGESFPTSNFLSEFLILFFLFLFSSSFAYTGPNL